MRRRPSATSRSASGDHDHEGVREEAEADPALVHVRTFFANAGNRSEQREADRDERRVHDDVGEERLVSQHECVTAAWRVVRPPDRGRRRHEPEHDRIPAERDRVDDEEDGVRARVRGRRDEAADQAADADAEVVRDALHRVGGVARLRSVSAATSEACPGQNAPLPRPARIAAANAAGTGGRAGSGRSPRRTDHRHDEHPPRADAVDQRADAGPTTSPATDVAATTSPAVPSEMPRTLWR